tara:strand:- start:4 stop:471 length:468 start_codon:yes stop_codon:yes gene_type:complete
MSRKSRRRNRRLATAAAILGGLALSNRGKGTEASNLIPQGGGRDAATMKMPINVTPSRTEPFEIITPKANRNMKSIFVGDDGSITKGNRKFPNKEAYAAFMQENRRPKSMRVPGQAGIMTGDLGGAFDYMGMKKGGRVKKGFAKKKKQANKMRKK